MPSFVLLKQNTTLAPNKGPYLALKLVGTLLNMIEHCLIGFKVLSTVFEQHSFY